MDTIHQWRAVRVSEVSVPAQKGREINLVNSLYQ